MPQGGFLTKHSLYKTIMQMPYTDYLQTFPTQTIMQIQHPKSICHCLITIPYGDSIYKVLHKTFLITIPRLQTRPGNGTRTRIHLHMPMHLYAYVTGGAFSYPSQSGGRRAQDLWRLIANPFNICLGTLRPKTRIPPDVYSRTLPRCSGLPGALTSMGRDVKQSMRFIQCFEHWPVWGLLR